MPGVAAEESGDIQECTLTGNLCSLVAKGDLGNLLDRACRVDPVVVGISGNISILDSSAYMCFVDMCVISDLCHVWPVSF